MNGAAFIFLSVNTLNVTSYKILYNYGDYLYKIY